MIIYDAVMDQLSNSADIGSWAGPALTIAGMVLTLGLAVYFAVPRGRTRPVRARVLLRALLPRRIVASASGRTDIAWFVFNSVFFASTFGWAIWSGGWYASKLSIVFDQWFGSAPLIQAPAWVATLVMAFMLFLAYEFAYWLNHSLSHRVGWMWEFHKVHHTAESLTPLTNYRVHPVDTIIFYNMAAASGGLAMVIVQQLLGDTTPGYFSYGLNALTFLITIAFVHLQHTHLWISFPGRAGRWLLSPAHHQIHHSVHEHHHDRNFGSTLAIFDRMFGTLHIPTAKREKLRFGVDGIGYDPHSPQGATLFPFVDAARRLLPDRPERPASTAAQSAH